MKALQSFLDGRKERRREQHKQRLTRDAERLINIREKWGKLYLTIDGIPLISKPENELITLLQDARATYILAHLD